MSNTSQPQPRNLVKLISEFSDIGEVKDSTISDGRTDYPCQYITLGNRTHLYKVEDRFYVDFEFDFQKLDTNLIKRFNLERYFEVEEAKPIKKTRKRTKK